ncbi:MAG TPA: hypothetical protein VMB34_28975 [Acetobacteraceae bacterium]|nr:hypothetical protein [Acetobacteraceae bacterium]
MAFVIEQISPVEALLPDSYDDRAEAERSVLQIISKYPHHGVNEEQGYWWGRDGQDIFQFVIR